MMYLEIESPLFYTIFNGLILLGFIFLLFKLTERFYFKIFNRSLYIHLYLYKKKLPVKEREFISSHFKFYRELSAQRKTYFEHRLIQFIKSKEFIGRDGFVVARNEELLLGATAVMLTFGMKYYHIRIIERIIIYPGEFYSTVSDDYHKGEFNPKLNAIVFSWKDFLQGFKIENDNLNLGIHEFTHAIHFNSLTETDYSSRIFKRSFAELTLFLSQNEPLRKELIASQYFRDYAFTNQFEFLAVLIENFIETPKNFKSHFPNLYRKVKQLLKFNFANY
jgi:Mlc titration factor MtfA (ptsG expression regulator)